MAVTILVGKAEHQVGDRRCGECWLGYPKKCQCGGFIHAEFVKESWDRVVTLTFRCDQCADKYKEKVYAVHERRSRKSDERRGRGPAKGSGRLGGRVREVRKVAEGQGDNPAGGDTEVPQPDL